MTVSPELLDAFRFHQQERNPAARYPRGATFSAPHAAHSLKMARQDVAAGRKRYPSDRIYSPATRQESGLTFVEVARCGFRLVGNVEPENARLYTDKTGELGWYTNPFGESSRDGTGLCWGVVYQLPGRDGKARFVAGYVMGGMDDENPTLDLRDIRTDSTADAWDHKPGDLDAARDLAHTADAMARRAAEDEKEYQSAWQAGSRFADLGQEVAADRRELLRVLGERKAAKATTAPDAYPAFCALVRREVRSVLASIAKARKQREALQSGQYDARGETSLYWDTRDPRLVAAFREGAGLTASA